MMLPLMVHDGKDVSFHKMHVSMISPSIPLFSSYWKELRCEGKHQASEMHLEEFELHQLTSSLGLGMWNFGHLPLESVNEELSQSAVVTSLLIFFTNTFFTSLAFIFPMLLQALSLTFLSHKSSL